MSHAPRPPLDLSQLRVFPLAKRQSLTRADEIIVDPDREPKPLSDVNQQRVKSAAAAVRRRRPRRGWPRASCPARAWRWRSCG
mgnify:CR=1 FL=1